MKHQEIITIILEVSSVHLCWDHYYLIVCVSKRKCCIKWLIRPFYEAISEIQWKIHYTSFPRPSWNPVCVRMFVLVCMICVRECLCLCPFSYLYSSLSLHVFACTYGSVWSVVSCWALRSVITASFRVLSIHSFPPVFPSSPLPSIRRPAALKSIKTLPCFLISRLENKPGIPVSQLHARLLWLMHRLTLTGTHILLSVVVLHHRVAHLLFWWFQPSKKIPATPKMFLQGCISV